MDKKKLKIAFLSFYSGEISRGVETYVHELGNELVDRGHKVFVYQNGPERQNANYHTKTIGINIDCNKSGGDIPFINYRSILVKNFTEKVIDKIDTNIDIVVTTGGQWQTVLIRKWARKYNVVHVISGQSGPGRDDRINLAATPDSFVALTHYQKKWAEKAVPFIKNRIDVIPNGVDVKRYSNPKKINLNLPKPIILNVAALQDFKRQHLAIQAVAKLEKGSLLLVGKGSEGERLQALGDKLLPNRFSISEYPYEEMSSVYASADIFTFPTASWESFGIVLLEAMASGLPVVATDDPIRKEIVGDAGIFIDPTDADSYAKAIQKGLNTDWKNKPRKQAEKFSWDKIAYQYELLFYELIQKK